MVNEPRVCHFNQRIYFINFEGYLAQFEMKTRRTVFVFNMFNINV